MSAANMQEARELLDHLFALHAAAYDHECDECVKHAEALLTAWNEGRIGIIGPEVPLV